MREGDAGAGARDEAVAEAASGDGHDGRTDGLLGLDPDPPIDDLLALDLKENLDKTENPAEATAATDSAEANKSLPVTLFSCCLLRMFLSSSPSTEVPNAVSVAA